MMRLLTVPSNKKMIYEMVEGWGLVGQEGEVEFEDYYEINDFGTRLKEVENIILDLQSDAI